MKRARDVSKKVLLDLYLKAWCAVTLGQQDACSDRHHGLFDLVVKGERQIAKVNLLCARLAVVIRHFSLTLKKFQQKDAASFVGRSIAEGKAAGPSKFCFRAQKHPNVWQEV